MSEDESNEEEEETEEHINEDSENEDCESSKEILLILWEEEEELLCSSESDSFAKALKYLDPDAAGSICRALFQGRTIESWKMEDLSPSNIPYRHAFQLTDYNHISFPPIKMPLKYDLVVKEKTKGMLTSLNN